ncbi:MAG: 30S ribosomal protein S13 [Patescibacteria group bacterium]
MARIAGVELQDNWKVDYALTRISGVGWSLSRGIVASLKISSEKRVKDLKSEEINKIASKLDEIPTEGELSRIVRTNISRLQAIGSYRGSRHQKGLPSRGQRTKSNARTKRGKRKTIGAFKKEALAKIKSAKPAGEK